MRLCRFQITFHSQVRCDVLALLPNFLISDNSPLDNVFNNFFNHGKIDNQLPNFNHLCRTFGELLKFCFLWGFLKWKFFLSYA